MYERENSILEPGASFGGATGLSWQVNCPQCEPPQQGVDRYGMEGYGPDHEAVTVHPDRDEYESPMGTRGGRVEIKLTCVYGHYFTLIIANHKGAEFIGIHY